MSIIKIDATDTRQFEPSTGEPLPRGLYQFELVKPLAVTKAKSSTNNVVNVELRCCDDREAGKYMGKVVYDTIVINPKSMWKLNHFAMGTGIYTKESILAEGGIDLDRFVPVQTHIWASVSVEAQLDANKQPKLDADGQPKMRNRIEEYKFDAAGK